MRLPHDRDISHILTIDNIGKIEEIAYINTFKIIKFLYLCVILQGCFYCNKICGHELKTYYVKIIDIRFEIKIYKVLFFYLYFHFTILDWFLFDNLLIYVLNCSRNAEGTFYFYLAFYYIFLSISFACLFVCDYVCKLHHHFETFILCKLNFHIFL